VGYSELTTEKVVIVFSNNFVRFKEQVFYKILLTESSKYWSIFDDFPKQMEQALFGGGTKIRFNDDHALLFEVS